MLLGCVFALNYGVLFLLLYIQEKVQKVSSDHAYHIALVRAIRNNKNRFVNGIPQVIGEDNFSYSQLIHWVYSFLPYELIFKRFFIVSVVVNFLTLTVHLLICAWFFNVISFSIGRNMYFLLCGILYVITPFNWAEWNAKNAGISIRGVGLLLCYIYSYLMVLYSLNESLLVFSFIGVVSFLILLSSLFAYQYVLLSLPFYFLFCKEPLLLLIPIANVLFFLLVMPRVATSFLRGQFWYKYIYFRYLARIFVLKSRYSIWRDFVWDIWKKLSVDFPRGMVYAFYNPIVSLLVSIPLLPLLIMAIGMERTGLSFNEKESAMIFPVIVSMIIFIATSFRLTRFLGEPERYVEIALPFIVVSNVYYLPDKTFVSIAMVLAVSIIVISIYFKIASYKKSNNYNKSDEKYRIKEIIDKENNEEGIRLFSNDVQFLKPFLSFKDVKILLPNVECRFTGGYHFKEIYNVEYPYVNKEVVLGMIHKFKINWFILDVLIDKSIIASDNNVKLIEVASYSKYKIFKVNSR